MLAEFDDLAARSESCADAKSLVELAALLYRKIFIRYFAPDHNQDILPERETEEWGARSRTGGHRVDADRGDGTPIRQGGRGIGRWPRRPAGRRARRHSGVSDAQLWPQLSDRAGDGGDRKRCLHRHPRGAKAPLHRRPERGRLRGQRAPRPVAARQSGRQPQNAPRARGRRASGHPQHRAGLSQCAEPAQRAGRLPRRPRRAAKRSALEGQPLRKSAAF